MKQLTLKVLGISTVIWAPTGALGQVVLSNSQEKPVIAPNEIGGKLYFERLTTAPDRPSLVLRYGKVKLGSESVELDGRVLVRDKDYVMDYGSGVVYLKIPVRDGQSVSVQYRYDEATGTQGTFGVGNGGSKFQGFTFQLNPNTSMILGMGITERMSDGTVLSSNVYGLNNSFKFGSGTLKGLYMVGDRKRVKSENLFGDKNSSGSDDWEGKSEAIVQNLEFGMLGGKTRFGYQNIGDKFGGFSAFESAGYNQQQINQFSNEKGLQRRSFEAEGIGGKGLNAGVGVKTVGDDNGSITWRNYSGKLFGFGLSYNTTLVESGFTRFNSIAEGDRAQLAKEKGLDRQAFNANKKFKGGSWSFDSTKVETADGPGLYRRNFNLESGFIKASFGDQHVQKGFGRFGDLREADRDQLSREGGLVRENKSFSIAPKGGPALSWAKSDVRTDTGDFKASDFAFGLGKLSLQYNQRDVAAGFGSLGQMGQADVNSHLTSIVKMLDPNAILQGQDVGGWGNLVGLNRTNLRANFDLGKGSNLGYNSNSISGLADSLNVRQYSLSTPKLSASYRSQDTGKDFSEAGRLLFSEQQRLGTATGLQKVDFNFDASLSGAKKLNYSKMSANDEGGSAFRQAFNFSDKKFNVNYTRRSVDPGFKSLPGMVDPQRDILLGMVGFDQSELVGNWQLLPSLNFSFFDTKAMNRTTGFGRFGSNMAMKWNPDKLTEVVASSLEVKQTDPTQPLVDQQIDKYAISRNLGKFGQLTLTGEKATFDGSQEKNPDSDTQSITYENQITKSTSIRTQQSLTRYENGEHETTVSNSISQALSSRFGVSVTNTQIAREGDRPDEVHRDYGFWVDFGKNIRLNYKGVRNMKGESEGDLHNEVGITPGQIQGVSVGGSYVRNGWDDRRDQHIGNVSLSNVKPLTMGFLRDVRFNYNVDSARDMDQWQKENRSMGFGARVGAFAFGFDYKSQSLPLGDRAIDRVINFTTDITGKSWIRADVKYNSRTLPMGQQATIRDYRITVDPIKNWQVVHSLTTNPLQADGNALLGAIATPARSNKWKVAYSGSKKTTFGMTYEEYFNEQNNQQSSALKIGAVLFANNPSPLELEYVSAETFTNGQYQRSHGFNLAYSQRPGPNQSLTFKISNLNWELARPADQALQNWNMRLDYSWKF